MNGCTMGLLFHLCLTNLLTCENARIHWEDEKTLGANITYFIGAIPKNKIGIKI